MSHEKRTLEFYVLAAFFIALRAVPLRPAVGDPDPLLPGRDRRPHLPAQWRVAALVRQPVREARRSAISAPASSARCVLGLMVMVVTVVVSLLAGLAFRRNFAAPRALFYLTVASLVVPSIIISLGIGVVFQQIGFRPAWYTLGLRRASDLDAALRRAHHVRRLQPLLAGLRGSRARPRRHRPGRPSAMSCCR